MKKFRFLGIIISIMILCCSSLEVSAATLKDVFCAEYYADSYPDLKAAFGYNEKALYRHFLKYGIKENRQCSPIIDIVKYRSSYADLEEAFGNNWDAYVNHYFEYGIKEQRDGGGDFDPVAYAKAYGDIEAAFGNDYEAIAEHYLTYGIKENRTEGVVTLAEKKAAEEAAKKPVVTIKPVITPIIPVPTPTPEDEEITCTITVWASSKDQSDANPWLQTQCEAFAAEHPKWDITFVYGVCEEGDAQNQVVADVNAAADVFCYANDNMEVLLNAGAILELTGSNATYVKNNFAKTYVDSVTKNGKIYGVPYDANTWFMYYNTSIYSTEDVKSLETMLQKGTVMFPVSNSWYIPAFYLATGANFFGGINDGSAGINLGADNGLATTKYLVDLMANPNFKNGEFGDAYSGLMDGTIAAAFSGVWDYNNAKRFLGDNLGVAALPTINVNGNTCQLKNFSGTKAYGVNATTEYPEVATALALYLGGETAQTARFEARGTNSTELGMFTTPALGSVVTKLNDPVVNAVNNVYANCSIVQPYCAEMAEWWSPAAELGYEIANGTVTNENVEEKAEAFYKAINGN